VERAAIETLQRDVDAHFYQTISNNENDKNNPSPYSALLGWKHR